MELDAQEIKELIPHRYPFLLVDRIVELDPGERAVGIKGVTINEPFFQGHFPDNPIMPGVLVVEALAQVGAVTIMAVEENRGKLGLFAGIDGLRFKRQVRPGDRLRLEMVVTRMRRRIGKGNVEATVDGETAVQGELMFAVADEESL